MAGTNNCGALMEDWALPSPSPRTLMSSFWSEEFSSGPFSHIISDNSSSKPQDGINKNKISFDSSEEDAMQETKASLQLESNLFDSNEKLTSHGGLAERMAARAGFGVLKIDTSRVSSSAPVRSPVTIPPGVSPQELLESPVFLPKDIVQPSPTTGKLPFLIPHDCKSTTLSVHNKNEDCLHDNTAFSFQPILRSKPPNFSAAEKGASVVCQNQSSANDNQKESSLQSKPIETKYVTDTALAQPTTCDSMLDNDQPSLADEQEESEENQNGEYSSTLVTTPAEDGYNWRKYGQKQVKNSEHPRSYYKCTHPDCPVKKKVERSQDGHITEIVYKGSHSHPLPPPNRRPSVPLSQFNDLQADGQENFGSEPGHIAATSRGSTPNGCVHEVHSGVLETKLSGSLIPTEIADTSVTESREAMDVSSTISSSDKDDKATLSSIPLTFDGDDDETESKRRKMDASDTTNTMTSTLDMATMASRAVREPRIIVQTTSEVDILDDGYRWRKYGQKVVKGNPNPRSYYKCTHAGCGVRKHVERASNDLKSVITTYEGKHNHEVPAARNSSRHPSSGAAQQASNLQQRPQTEQDSIAQFSNVASYGSFCLPQLSAASGGFCFGMLPPGMAVPAVPVHIPGHPPAMRHYPGLILSRGGSGMKVNPAVTRSGSETYQQLMGRLPQGPHISIA